MSFARNFALGQQIAQNAIDFYERERERKMLRQAAEAKPTELANAYTDADAAQLHALANARDQNGNAYYSLEALPDGRYGLKPNFAAPTAEGGQTASGQTVATFGPRATAVEFLGRRYAPEDLTDNRIAGLRMQRMADVIAQRDPVTAMQMRRGLAQEERDATRFNWESQMQPLKMQQAEMAAKQGEITLSQAEREQAAQKILDEVAKMPEEALQIYAAQLNSNESNFPFLYTGKTNDGYAFLSLDKFNMPTGQPIVLNRAQLRDVAGAAVLGMAGFGNESMALLRNANKDLYDILSKWNQAAVQSTQSQNDALSKGRQDEIARRRLGLEAARLQADKERAVRPNFMPFETERGIELFDLNKLPTDEMGRAKLPEGLLPQRTRRIMTPKERADLEATYLAAGADARTAALKVAIAAGDVTPEQEASMLKVEPAKVQQAKLQQWKALDPMFAAKVELLLRQTAQPPTPAQEASPGLPPPNVRQQSQQPAGASSVPTRSPVGVGPARFPWEDPTGGW